MSKEFIPGEYGWVSQDTPPVNHNTVVVLLWLINEQVYQEVFGFYEKGKWFLRGVDDDEFDIKGWFAYPFTPNNN